MIIDYSVDSKSYKENILDYKGIFHWECPTCGAKHSLIRHATYQRNLISFREGILVEESLCILRLKCNSCIHTHAILPFDVIPFSIYSGVTILTICSMVLLGGLSPEKVCEDLPLSYQLVYGFLKLLLLFHSEITLFLRHFHEWNAAFSPTPKDVLYRFQGFSPSRKFFQNYLYYHRSPLFLKRNCSSTYPFWIGF